MSKENKKKVDGWEPMVLGKVLKYEQPYKYAVDSTEYNADSGIPVLTAGKSFILGYTNETHNVYNNFPVIIFDDFTTDSKYVDFPFKVKSSAMKFLKERNKDEVSLKFVFEILQALKLQSTGGDHKRRWISEYSKIEIAAPGYKEQTRIAEILSTADEAIANTEALIAKYQRIKTGLMQDLLTKGIDEHGNIRSKATHKFVVKNGIEVPEEWEVLPLDEAAIVVMGQSPKGDTYNKDGKGLPLINGPVEFGERYPVQIQWTTHPTKLCENGDVLFCVRGSTTGRMNIANDKFCIGRGVAAIRGIFEKSYSNYLEYQMISVAESIISEAKGSGSTFPSITGERLKSTLIRLPKFNEQSKIIERIEASSEELSSLKNSLFKIRLIKTGLMQDLLSGKVRVM
jgi:type I restriction enzyme S subunit